MSLLRLLDYRVWARERVLSAAGPLPPEQFTQPVTSSFGSVRDTLAHILSADVTWAARLNGISPDGHLDPALFPTVAALKDRWRQADADLRTAAAADPDRLVTYRTFDGRSEHSQPIWQIIQHVVNHQTYHLGQVATLLRQLGASPAPAIDLILFDRQTAR